MPQAYVTMKGTHKNKVQKRGMRDVKWSLQERQNTKILTDTQQSHRYPLIYAAIYWAAANSEKSSNKFFDRGENVKTV